MELPEIRYYKPQAFETRYPRPKRGVLSCLQLDHRDGNGRIVSVDSIKFYDPSARPIGDGLISAKGSSSRPILESYSQDCANIAATDKDHYGVLHLTWRGLVRKDLQQFLAEFDPETRKIVVAPFLETLEFTRDHNLQLVDAVMPGFIEETESVRPIFNFRKAVEAVLENESALFHDVEDRLVMASKRNSVKGTNLLRVGSPRLYSPCDPGEVIHWPNVN